MGKCLETVGNFGQGLFAAARVLPDIFSDENPLHVIMQLRSKQLREHGLAVQEILHKVTRHIPIIDTPRKSGRREESWWLDSVCILSEGGPVENDNEFFIFYSDPQKSSIDVEDRFATATWQFCEVKDDLACSCNPNRVDELHESVNMAGKKIGKDTNPTPLQRDIISDRLLPASKYQ